MLNYNDIGLKEPRFYQDVFVEGRVEGEAAMLLRLLERKFRPLPESARQRRRRNLAGVGRARPGRRQLGRGLGALRHRRVLASPVRSV